MTETELDELAHELQTQDNRATGHPLFVVQQKRCVWGMDSEYCDDYEWRTRDDPECHYTVDEIQAAIQEEVEAEHGQPVSDIDGVSGPRERNPEEYGYEKVYYCEYWDFVTAHLTERAATRYMNENAHNLNEPRVYVTSQYRCHEFNAVVEHLKKTPPPPPEDDAMSDTKHDPVKLAEDTIRHLHTDSDPRAQRAVTLARAVLDLAAENDGFRAMSETARALEPDLLAELDPVCPTCRAPWGKLSLFLESARRLRHQRDAYREALIRIRAVGGACTCDGYVGPCGCGAHCSEIADAALAGEVDDG